MRRMVAAARRRRPRRRRLPNTRFARRGLTVPVGFLHL